MKRKIAFLLAVVMTFGLLSVNAFGALTSNTIWGSAVSPDENDVLIERGAWVTSTTANQLAPDLVIAQPYSTVTGYSVIRPYQEFLVKLEGAEWNFRANDVSANLGAAKTGLKDLIAVSGTNATAMRLYDTTAPAGSYGWKDADALSNTVWSTSNQTGLVTDSASTNAGLASNTSTYNTGNGIFIPSGINTTLPEKIGHRVWGTYYRLSATSTYYKDSAGKYRDEIPYVLTVSATDPTVARVTVLAGGVGFNSDLGGYDDVNSILVIPTAAIITSDTAVTVIVDNNYTDTVSNSSHLISAAARSTSLSSTVSPETQSDKYVFTYNLTTSEAVVGSMSSGVGYIQASPGFEFASASVSKSGGANDVLFDSFVIGGDLVLRTDSDNDPTSGTADMRNTRFTNNYLADGWLAGYTSAYPVYDNLITDEPDLATIIGWFPSGWRNAQNNTPILTYDTKSDGTTDYTRLKVNFVGVDGTGMLTKSTSARGIFTIEGLKMVATSNVDALSSDDVYVTLYSKDSKMFKNEQEVKVGTRVYEGVYFQYQNADATMPTPFTGRSPAAARRVQFGEYTIGSWNSAGITTFVLSDNAKFQKVRLRGTNAKGLNAVDSDSYTEVFANGETIRIGDDTFVTLTDNELKVERLRNDVTTKRTLLDIIPYVSVALGEPGDVTLTADYTGSGDLSDDTLVIATANDPISVEMSTVESIVRAGYQTQTVAIGDIIISENEPGALAANSVLDVVLPNEILATGVQFVKQALPKAQTLVTEGNLGLTKVEYTTTLNASNTTVLSGYDTLRITTGKASTTASTIVLSGLVVDVYESPYIHNTGVIATAQGTAVVKTDNAFAKDSGVRFTIIDVASDVPTQTYANAKFNDYLEFIVGADTYTMDGVSYDTSGVYLDKLDTNSFFVPTRLAAEAFGLTSEELVWTDARSTTGKEFVNFTTFDGKQIRFTVEENKTADSFFYLVDGVPVPMTNEEGDQLACVRQGEFILVPVRILGDLFGYEVEWVAPAADGSGEGFRYVAAQ